MNEKKKLEKPITIIREEFIHELADVINNSNLPAFIIEPILKDFLNETRLIMRKQYEIEKAQYDALLSGNGQDYEQCV